MYVQGVSTAKVAKITEQLCGCEISSSEISRVAATLDDELDKWRNRPLGEIKYLIVDARYEKIRGAGSVRDCAVLVAVGVAPDGYRSVLGVSVSLSEAEVHWREFFKSLIARGMPSLLWPTATANRNALCGKTAQSLRENHATRGRLFGGFVAPLHRRFVFPQGGLPNKT
jgi:transposase-like protein